jgi:hypothetical protein
MLSAHKGSTACRCESYSMSVSGLEPAYWSILVVAEGEQL